MITSFKLVYDSCCAAKTDINEHLPTLYEYAKRCQFITEMGVRDGQSTSAFLYANPLRLISYDLDQFRREEDRQELAHCLLPVSIRNNEDCE